MSQYSAKQSQNIERPLGYLQIPACHIPKTGKGSHELDFDVTFDFVAAANEVYMGLNRVDARAELGDKDFLRFVKIKYLKFLNLVHKNPEVHMVAPDDVEAFWETHLIRPEMYRRDCVRLFGEVIPHHIETKPCMRAKGLENSKMLWGTVYDECWEDLEHMVLPEELKEKAEMMEVTIDDVIEDRQWIGFYKVYTSNVRDWDEFLNRSVVAYKRFLGLCAEDLSHPEAMEPTYAMDLCWHTHMFHPIEYHECCERLSGFLIVHEPWPKSMTVEQMFEGQAKFDERWQERFGGESIHDYTF